MVRDEDIGSDVKKAFGKAAFKDIGASALDPGVCAVKDDLRLATPQD
jgi:hypothetical protein